MPSDSSDHRRPTAAKPPHAAFGAPTPEPQHLPCPRCDSTNTKFCYYNNYNFSQPRHFCKACRRYWTHGGTLRDIPVGGGSRKNAKRCRVSTAVSAVSSGFEYRRMAPMAAGAGSGAGATPMLLPFAGDHGGAVQFLGDGKPAGSFTSLLSNNIQSPALYGFDELSFGLGRTIWPFSGVGDGGDAVAGGGNSWVLDGGDGGGEGFALPELAISTTGNAMK